MAPAHSRLSAALDDAGTDGYLVDADGTDSDQYYLSRHRALDEFVTLYTDGRVVLLVPDPECDLAEAESAADEVRGLSAFGYREAAEQMDPRRAKKLVTADFVADYGVESVSVPVSFPTGTADLLREAGVDVVPDFAYALRDVRAVKNDREVEHLRATQAVNEDALAAAEAMLERATVADGVLHLDGDVLTSERVRDRIERALLDGGCELDQYIVACGPAAARGHDTGSGPLRAGDPIVVDVFPRHEETRYFGDVTRTFVKGDPSSKVEQWYELTREAFDAALDALGAGVSGEAVHDAACEVFEAAGYATRRTEDAPEDGFTHATGHGVGLDVHEAPYLAGQGGDLEAGHVVTVEPGLYEQGVAGVRLEDLVVVTEDGYENLTDYPRDLRVV